MICKYVTANTLLSISINRTYNIRNLLSMEPWAAAKKALSKCRAATSSCPGSKPKATCPECRVSHVGR